MKALSILQPWAEAIVCGAKRIETRNWATRYRGPLLIHTGKSREGIDGLMNIWHMGSVAFPCKPFGVDNYYDLWERIWGCPRGALLATCELVDCLPIKRDLRGGAPYLWDEIRRKAYYLSPDEEALGNYSTDEQRYGWVMGDVRPLPKPIPYRGMQGLFTVPDSVLEGQR